MNATFHNYIIINFKTPTYFEAFLMTPYLNDHDSDDNTDYNGFPPKLKVYTSLNKNKELSLHTVFVGTPIQPLGEAQFVFSSSVN